MSFSFSNSDGLWSIRLPIAPRPLWAYKYLPDGENILVRETLGETTAIIEAIESHGATRLTREFLKQITDDYELRPEIREILVEFGVGQSSAELGRDLRLMVNRTLHNYCIMLDS